MSEKNEKKERKFKLMTEEAGLQETAKKQAKDISKMYEDRDKKALGARDHLVSQLEVTSDKYRTANGVMAALQVVRDVLGDVTDYVEEISIAKTAATKMSGIAQKMADVAKGLDPENMDALCVGFYDPVFSEGKGSALEMIDELMTLQLCQNVGPNAEDVAEFCRTADEEIEKARESLRTFCSENEIDFEELCGPHDKCPDCLCMDCEKDCKSGKQIEEGQSAYDICPDFKAVED
jgi:hypothetical protein